MGAFYDDIPDYLIDWIRAQQMFWVASAPLSPDGHVNVSPKGLAGTFKVLDNKTVCYQDLTGSGSETIAHLRENARITVMFQEFEGAPRIVRLFGTGLWHEYGTPEYERLCPVSERLPGSRSVIVVHVHKVGSSCGFAVPRYKFDSHRTQLLEYFEKREASDSLSPDGKSTEGMLHYWGWKNSASIDGLPALYIGEQYAKYFKLNPCALSPFVADKKNIQNTDGHAIVPIEKGGKEQLKSVMLRCKENILEWATDPKFAVGVSVGMVAVLFLPARTQ